MKCSLNICCGNYNPWNPGFNYNIWDPRSVGIKPLTSSNMMCQWLLPIEGVAHRGRLRILSPCVTWAGRWPMCPRRRWELGWEGRRLQLGILEETQHSESILYIDVCMHRFNRLTQLPDCFQRDILKILLNIVEARYKNLLNFYVCVVWCSDESINSQE